MDSVSPTVIQNVKKEHDMSQQVGGPQGPQQQRVNVDISQATDVFCIGCEGSYFMEGMRIKRLSAILSPTGKEEMINVQVLLCMGCGLEMGQSPPAEREPTKQDVQ